MKIVIFTSNALRHKYIANMLAEDASQTLVVSECQAGDAGPYDEASPLTQEHFDRFREVEAKYFEEHAVFKSATLPILYKEVNLPFVYDAVAKFNPDAAFVYGSSIIKEPLLSAIPKGRFVNLHLGLSPYYRGSGTNFWPLANNEPEYVGATLLHIDAGIDTGDIITHVRPKFSVDDTAHTIGCKTIMEGGYALKKILSVLQRGEQLPRVKQWECSDEKIYRRKDFSDGVIRKYHANLQAGMMEKYLRGGEKKIKLVSL